MGNIFDTTKQNTEEEIKEKIDTIQHYYAKKMNEYQNNKEKEFSDKLNIIKEEYDYKISEILKKINIVCDKYEYTIKELSDEYCVIKQNYNNIINDVKSELDYFGNKINMSDEYYRNVVDKHDKKIREIEQNKLSELYLLSGNENINIIDTVTKSSTETKIKANTEQLYLRIKDNECELYGCMIIDKEYTLPDKINIFEHRILYIDANSTYSSSKNYSIIILDKNSIKLTNCVDITDEECNARTFRVYESCNKMRTININFKL